MKLLLFVLSLLPMAVLADDAVIAEVLNRIRQGGEGKFQYQETRLMELASAPWQGQGYMLTDASGSLVKLQLQPARVIMAISDEQMYYWDPAQNQRHSAPLSYGGAAAEQIAIFRSILQGQTEAFKEAYDFAAERDAKHWRLRMTPKPGQDEEAPTIEIAGDEDASKRHISIRQADGESTEYRIEKAPDQQTADYAIPDLLREAAGE